MPANGFKFKMLPQYLSKPLSLKIQLYFYKFYEQFLFSFVDEIIRAIKTLSNYQFWFLTQRPNIMKEYFKNQKNV